MIKKKSKDTEYECVTTPQIRKKRERIDSESRHLAK